MRRGILDEVDYMLSKVYHFIWLNADKERITINGQDIMYIPLPLIISGKGAKTAFSDAMVLTHVASRTLMIFVSWSETRSEKFRYTLYHEHLEGTFLLYKHAEEFERTGKLVTSALAYIADDEPAIAKLFKQSLKKRNDKFHLWALAMELSLVKKERSEDFFKRHLADAIKNRL